MVGLAGDRGIRTVHALAVDAAEVAVDDVEVGTVSTLAELMVGAIGTSPRSASFDSIRTWTPACQPRDR